MMNDEYSNRKLHIISVDLSADESLGNTLSTVVEKQAQLDWDIKVDAQHISFESGAKAHRSFKISKTLNEVAAWGLWWLP